MNPKQPLLRDINGYDILNQYEKQEELNLDDEEEVYSDREDLDE